MKENNLVGNATKKSINEKGFYAGLIAMVAPMALQNLLNTLTSADDTIMLSFLNQSALSAAALAGQVSFLLILIFMGISAGASVLTSQYWGKGDTRSIEKIMSIALRFAMAVGLLFFAASLFFPATIMRFFTPDPELIELGAMYLRVLAPGYLCMAFTNNYLIILRSIERVKFAAGVVAVAFIFNVVLNFVFIFGIDSLGIKSLGIVGAALATTLARVLEVILVGIYALRMKEIKIRKKDLFTLDPLLWKDYKKYSGPTVLNELLWGFGVTVNTAIIGHLGSDAISSNSIAHLVRQFAAVIIFGVANAAAVIIGKSIGAGKEEEARENAKRLINVALIFGAVGSVLILIARPFVIYLMRATFTEQAINYLSIQLLYMVFFVVMQAFNACMIVGVFRGGGDTKFGIFADVVGMWAFSIPVSFLGAFIFGWPVQVVLALVLCDELIKIPFIVWRYKSGAWLNNVTR